MIYIFLCDFSGYLGAGQQSQSVFNPNVNNLESQSPPKSPENNSVLNGQAHRFSNYQQQNGNNPGNNNQYNQQQNNGYNNNNGYHQNNRQPNGSFSNRNNNNNQYNPQQNNNNMNQNKYGHSSSNSAVMNNQLSSYNSPQVEIICLFFYSLRCDFASFWNNIYTEK